MDEIYNFVLQGKIPETVNTVSAALEGDTAPADIVSHALVPALTSRCELYEQDKISLPELLVSSECVKRSLPLLEAAAERAGTEPIGTALVCSVRGEMHDIGKNLVALMMKSAGLKVIDLGKNVSGEQIVDAIHYYKPLILGLSAMQKTTVGEQRKILQLLSEAGVRQDVKVLIGGIEASDEWAEEIGADSYTRNCVEAARMAKGYCVSAKR